MQQVTVIGTGYLGVTHAACMAELGHDVLGLDVDKWKIQQLADGRLPFFEPGLETLLVRNLNAGRLRFTNSYEEAADFGYVHFVCVGTPQEANRNSADLRYLEGVFDSLAPLLRSPCVVAGKSTVPVGTADRLAGRLSRLAPVGDDAELVWNPEFLREGCAVQDTLHPDRVITGVRSARGEQAMREIYQDLISSGVPFVVTDPPTAELAKVAANAFLATKISFINAISEVCETVGADINKISMSLSYDPRIGGDFLRAGLGFGGSCLAKDIRSFIDRANELRIGGALSFLREVDAINIRCRTRMVELTRELVGGSFTGRSIAVLGAAFKPDSDDVRDSPALAVASRIQAQGAQVSVYDPRAIGNAQRAYRSLRYAASAVDAARGAHAVLHMTEWDEFVSMPPNLLSDVVAARNIIDGRNSLDPERWRSAGWNFLALGQAHHSTEPVLTAADIRPECLRPRPPAVAPLGH
jgi:UDPglucose 6-dehydrogenase